MAFSASWLTGAPHSALLMVLDKCLPSTGHLYAQNKTHALGSGYFVGTDFCRELLFLPVALRFHVTQKSSKRISGHQHAASNSDDI